MLETVNGFIEVYDYFVGLRYSTAIIKDEDNKLWCGVALTPLEDIIGMPFNPGKIELTSDDLFYGSTSTNPILKSLGIAFLNAVSSYLLWGEGVAYDFNLVEDDDVVDLVHRFTSEPVVVIGHMGPLVKRLRNLGYKDVIVLERNPCYRCGTALPDTAIDRVVVPGSTLIVTGATLVNDTIDHIIDLSRKNNCKLLLVGPTAALYPYYLLNNGVYAVFSMYVEDIEKVFKVIKTGGGRWSFSKFCRHYVAYKCFK